MAELDVIGVMLTRPCNSGLSLLLFKGRSNGIGRTILPGNGVKPVRSVVAAGF
jgi:hypothetical protein